MRSQDKVENLPVGMAIEIIVTYAIQERPYSPGIAHLIVLLIDGIRIAMPTVLSVTMAIGSRCLSQQGAIAKRMPAFEEMASMYVLCSDKTGTLTPNNLSVDKNMIEVFSEGVDKDTVVLMAQEHQGWRIKMQLTLRSFQCWQIQRRKVLESPKSSSFHSSQQTRELH